MCPAEGGYGGEVNLPLEEGSNTPTQGSREFGVTLGSIWNRFRPLRGRFDISLGATPRWGFIGVSG